MDEMEGYTWFDLFVMYDLNAAGVLVFVFFSFTNLLGGWMWCCSVRMNVLALFKRSCTLFLLFVRKKCFGVYASAFICETMTWLVWLHAFFH